MDLQTEMSVSVNSISIAREIALLLTSVPGELLEKNSAAWVFIFFISVLFVVFSRCTFCILSKYF